jgi:hypothetical protein
MIRNTTYPLATSVLFAQRAAGHGVHAEALPIAAKPPENNASGGRVRARPFVGRFTDHACGRFC